MSLKSERFYKRSFIVCLVLAIVIKAVRGSFFGSNEILDIFLGSSPSFLYLFGLIALIPIVKSGIEFSAFKKMAIACSIGALAYELQQYWTSRVFDTFDIVATALAIITMLILHNRKTSNT